MRVDLSGSLETTNSMNQASGEHLPPNLSADQTKGGAIVAKLQGQYHQPDFELVLNMVQELHYLIGTWQTELGQLDRRIAEVRQSGPVVAGWMEPTPGQASTMPKEIEYQLCIMDETGQVAARDCPEPELFGISKALARHRKLKELLDRKSTLEANIKHILATLVNLRLDINC
jgi:hypothetical protein